MSERLDLQTYIIFRMDYPHDGVLRLALCRDPDPDRLCWSRCDADEGRLMCLIELKQKFLCAMQAIVAVLERDALYISSGCWLSICAQLTKLRVNIVFEQ